MIERAEAAIDEKTAAEMERKMRDATFSLEDFLSQLRQLRKMGNLNQLIGMIPGVKPGAAENLNVDEKQLSRIEAIVLSMTPEERLHPSEVLNGSRRKRIAAGSGTTVEEVNKLLKQFEQMKKMMKQFSSPGKMRGLMGGKMKLPF